MKQNFFGNGPIAVVATVGVAIALWSFTANGGDEVVAENDSPPVIADPWPQNRDRLEQLRTTGLTEHGADGENVEELIRESSMGARVWGQKQDEVPTMLLCGASILVNRIDRWDDLDAVERQRVVDDYLDWLSRWVIFVLTADVDQSYIDDNRDSIREVLNLIRQHGL